MKISEALGPSFSKFEQVFGSEEACAAYLQKRRWPDGFVCPACSSRRHALLKSRAYTSECLDCRRQTSVTAGTVMHRTKLPLTLWFAAAYLIAAHPASTWARSFEKVFDIPYTTAWLLTKKLRQTMYSGLLKGLVEVRYQEIAPHMGAGSFGHDIIVVAAMASLEIRVAAIPDDTPRSIEAFVRANVEPGATLMTDTGLQLPHYSQDLRHFEETPRRLPTTFRWLQSYLQQHKQPVEMSLKRFTAYHNDIFCQVSLDRVLGVTAGCTPASYWEIIGRQNPRRGLPTTRYRPRRRKTAIGMRVDGSKSDR